MHRHFFFFFREKKIFFENIEEFVEIIFVFLMSFAWERWMRESKINFNFVCFIEVALFWTLYKRKIKIFYFFLLYDEHGSHSNMTNATSVVKFPRKVVSTSF